MFLNTRIRSDALYISAKQLYVFLVTKVTDMYSVSQSFASSANFLESSGTANGKLWHTSLTGHCRFGTALLHYNHLISLSITLESF